MRKFSWLLLLIILAVSCNKEKEFDYPLVYTGEVTDIKNDGAVFSAKIVDLSRLDVIEFGFVWDSKTNPTIENSEKYIISEPPRIGVYNQHISTTLQTGVKYYVRTYIRNSKYITYGKEVVFTSLGSLAPQILDFMPKTGNLKDTLTIIGHNFSYKASNNQVQIGEFHATVIKANQDTLIVKVPEILNTISSPISISIQGNKATSTDNFNLIAPILNDFNEKTGVFGSQVTIAGNNFLANPNTIHIYFDSFKATIVNIQNQSIIVVVPDSLDKRQSNIIIRMNNLTVTSIDKFQLVPLSIDDFTPKVAITGNIITLTGNNFSPIPKNNLVTVGGLKATIVNATIDKLDVKVPLQDIGYYPSRNVSISVEVIGEKHDFNGTLLINDKWFRLKNSPISINNSGFTSDYKLVNCFNSNGKAYLGLNNTSEFWEYNAENDEWTKLEDFPGTPRWYGVGFIIENTLYFGTGSDYSIWNSLNDWWKYDIKSNRWSNMNNFGGGKRAGAIAFQINNIGYLGTGKSYNDYYSPNYTDLWYYKSTEDIWTKISDCPNVLCMALAISNLSEAFIGLSWNYYYYNYIYKYNPQNNSWNRLPNFPINTISNYPIGFNLLNTIYIKTEHDNDFFKYDEVNNCWTRTPCGILTDVRGGITFCEHGKAYVGLGQSNAMWEYDPSR